MLKKYRKYKNQKTIIDGISFDSKKESIRYAELKTLQKIGAITNLEIQPKIDLIVNGKKIGFYRGDFRYNTAQGETVLEDVKSPVTKTPVYKLKKKILETYDPPVKITEIM
ncbi:MAG: DUF1064 domain-containing protein [Betaproteobacteria bacterium]